MGVETFFETVKKISENNLGVIELINAAEILQSAGASNLASQLYALWVRCNPGDVRLYVAHFNHAVLLTNLGEITAAQNALECAIASNKDFLPSYINLGNLLEKQGKNEEAVAQWTILLDKVSAITRSAIDYKLMALKQLARIQEKGGSSSVAEAALRNSLDIKPDQPEIIQHLIATRLAQCEWPILSPWEDMSRTALLKGINPLSMAVYTDDPLLQLGNAWNYNKSFINYSADILQDNRPVAQFETKRRRRIGYLSSDLRNHAVGSIMAELFELHDRSEFEIFAYYCSTAAEDFLQKRIKEGVEHWVDVGSLSDDAIARRIASDGIDILIDVNGHTRDSRTKVFSARPAPIIVNWLGYPGSMGSPYHHYIIADEWIIPPGYEIYYSEKVLRLPCYQPNDRKRTASLIRPSRHEAGLPDMATVFCCFNDVHKILRPTFERWMTILKRVPESVLWLLDGGAEVNQRLKTFAEQSGVETARIIFAAKVSYSDHLARYPLADLFLDTSPYGAHVTASDSLWMGVPIVTVPGRSFASRVCASLTRAAGLPDLICGTVDEYVERAVTLGTDKAAIGKLKERLAAQRDSCVLFATDSLVRHLEELFRQMWTEFRQGKLARPDVTNLDAYRDIGCELDHEAVEMLTVREYHTIYRARLAHRHGIYPLCADRRLWTAADMAQRTDQGQADREIYLPPEAASR